MSNLLSSLRNSVEALHLFQRGVETTANNVNNASTPGYARQGIRLIANRFDPDFGLAGGVSYGGLWNSRNTYAESAVRRQLEYYGRSREKVDQLSAVEPVFDIKDDSGVAGALNRFYETFSSLSVAPNDVSARQTALDRSAELARAFQRTANGLIDAAQTADAKINTLISRINDAGKEIRQINIEFRNHLDARNDAGLAAKLATTLEKLSDLVDFTAIQQEDGSMTVFLGGQHLFVIGDSQYDIQGDISGQTTEVRDFSGKLVTPNLTRGRLAGLLELRNTDLPGYQLELDRLAAAVADEVNSILSGGVDLNGQPPQDPLFAYDASLGAARTLALGNLAPQQLALAAATAPGGNANALAIASISGAKLLDGFSATQFYGTIAARAGRALATERETMTTQELLVSQARSLRDEYSRVNLDEEAATLLSFQRAYQAAARIVQTLDEMTQTMINLIR